MELLTQAGLSIRMDTSSSIGAGVCTPCHRPHKDYTPEKHNSGSFTMAAKGKELCFICHENLQKSMTGKFIHGPVAMGDCIACHDPHQSDAKFSMKKPTTSALCFGCHQQTLVLDQQTTTLTGFRDGSKNLHFVHVNKKKGRSCKACHDDFK